MAKDNWIWIRLLLSDISVSFSDLEKIDTDTAYMLNAALDIAQEQAEKKRGE